MMNDYKTENSNGATKPLPKDADLLPAHES